MIWRWEVVAEKLNDPKHGAEIGVKEGRFISYMLEKFPCLAMYAIDPWVYQPAGNETYQEWDWDNIYKQYKEKTAKFTDRVIELRMFSYEAAKIVSDHSLDFVFIDAQHDYHSVAWDIALWAPKVKPGGMLCGHDYAPKFPGVVRAVKEKFGEVETGENDVWFKRL